MNNVCSLSCCFCWGSWGPAFPRAFRPGAYPRKNWSCTVDWWRDSRDARTCAYELSRVCSLFKFNGRLRVTIWTRRKASNRSSARAAQHNSSQGNRNNSLKIAHSGRTNKKFAKCWRDIQYFICYNICVILGQSSFEIMPLTIFAPFLLWHGEKRGISSIRCNTVSNLTTRNRCQRLGKGFEESGFETWPVHSGSSMLRNLSMLFLCCTVFRKKRKRPARRT